MKKLTLWAACATAMMAGAVYGANAMNKKSPPDGYDLKALVEPITFSCELRDVRLTRVIDRMSSGESAVTRETRSSSGRRTDSSSTRSATESATVNSSSTHNENGHRCGTKFDAGGGVKWGLIPYGKVGGEYSEDEVDELRRSTDKTASNKRGNSTTNTTANERITAEGQDTTSEITNESRLGNYMLVFSVALRNMDATDRLKVDGAHMRAQLSSGDLPGTITALYKERGEFWLGAEETICEFTYLVEDAKMLKALQYLERNGKLSQLNLSRSGADIVVISEKTGRNVLSDLNAAEAHRPGTRFSIEFGELMTLPDWRVSRRHSANSGPRGKRVSIHEALLAIQSVVIETSEVLPSEVFTFAEDGSLTNVVDRPLLDTDSDGLFRMFALRLTKNNGATELSLPNAEIMKGEIANYAKVALFSFDLEEFVNVSFENPEYFSGLKNEVEKYLGSSSDKKAYDVYRGFLEKRIREEDARPLPKDMTTITAVDVKRYKERAEAGIPNMQFKFARCLFEEHGVAEDKVEAVKWYRKAAEQGHTEAQFCLGVCYYTCEGAARDVVEAVRWFRKAANQGNAKAQYNLGMCYHTGEGVEKNEGLAVNWWREAAKQGHNVAQNKLRSMEVEDNRNAQNQQVEQVRPQKPKKLKTGDTKTITLPGGATMEMIYCGPGTFTMGSPISEVGRDNDEVQHKVTLTKGFWLGKYEVTKAQWKSVMGNNPSFFGGDKGPVENVSWDDCQQFIHKVNLHRNYGARLPTEAEWEYACRAGSTGAYGGNGRLDDMGWYRSNSKESIWVVGQKRANAWGFYDMHGNVSEWCNDWRGGRYSGDVTDPLGPASDTWWFDNGHHVYRGGSWDSLANWCRSAYRSTCYHSNRLKNMGFRLYCSAESSK